MTIRRLLAGLPSRFVFVVGKGGVGKSTAASALALRLAHASRRVHLVSTDPAHSLGDLFGAALPPGRPAPSPCGPSLVLEELDARARARAWVAEVAEPLLELVELGTYLDSDDVRPFLDLTLPGVDEFMGALRLEELEGEEDGPDRVVVDTAPTGHTLRLLGAGELLEGWVRALEAMAGKAGAVQERLLRRRVRLRGEDVLEELRGRVARFEERVLGDADFVVVSRGDPVVRRETERLVGRLRERRLRVAGELRVGGNGKREGASPERGGVPFFRVPRAQGLQGCEGLLRWGEPGPDEEGRGEGPSSEGLRTEDEDANELGGGDLGPAGISAREILFFAGKGGVGKSTCAAAHAAVLARREPVLLLSTDPAGSLQDILAVEGDLHEGVTLLGDRLRIRQVDAEGEFRAFRERYRNEIRAAFERLGLDRSARLDRRVMESLLGLAPPGIDEIFALHAIWEERRSRRALVVDTAPTGHFLRLIEMPELALQWIQAVLRLLLKYRSALGLDEVAEELLQFARGSRSLLEVLRSSERAGTVLVTLDAPVVRSESERLRAALEESGTPLLAVVRNRAGEDPAGRSDGSGPPMGVVGIRAPFLSSPPTGIDALLAFHARWERDE